MSYHHEFEIAWQGLKEGLHEYQYEINDQVLKELGYEHPDFKNLEVSVDLKFEKENSFFILQFDLQGKAEVFCDRCGDLFSLPLWDEYKLVVKLTDSEEKAAEMNNEEADVVFIPRSESVINVFEWVFEFIMLSFPIQKIHPDLADGKSGCNPEALKLLREMSHSEEHSEKTIWKDLEKLKNNLEK